MAIDAIMKRSRDAARRARAALAAAEPGVDRYALAAASGPLDEIRADTDLVQRLRDIDERLDDRQRRLRSLRQDTDRPPEIRRRQVARLEAEIAQLTTARRDLEAEARAISLPAQPKPKPGLPGPAGELTDVGTASENRSLQPGPASVSPENTGKMHIGPAPTSFPRAAADSPKSAPIQKKSGQRPAAPSGDRGTRNSGPAAATANARDIWAAGLPAVPLTDDGAVDTDALRKGQVYRMPESAGGGLGRWTNGLFYNYDGKSDWNFRSVADLDAYSGVSGQPTADQRRKFFLNLIMAGGGFMPAVFLEKPDIGAFNRENTEGLWAAQGDDEVSFRLGDGPVFLTLPDDAAAILLRNWDDFKTRMTLLSRLFADDLTLSELRRLIEAEVFKGIPESGWSEPAALRPDGMTYDFEDPYGAQKHLARLRMRAFDEMIEGIRRGASDEEVAQLIRDFQEIMLPELMGAGRFLKEFVKDMVPGLNNLRSGIHFWNDLREIKEEWKEGDIAGLAGNSLLLLLDGLGMIPIVGSAFAPVRTALKKGARAVGAALPRLDGLAAQAQLWRHRLQWPNREHKIDPSRIFGAIFDKLPPDIQGKVRSKTNFAFGGAGEEYQQGLLGRMDPAAQGQTHVNIPPHLQPMLGGRKFRRYDGLARDATDLFVEDIMGWFDPLIGRQWDRFQAGFKHYEFKTGAAWNRFQEIVDAFANNNPGQLTDVFGNAVERVERARIYPEQIPMGLAIRHAQERFAELVANNVIDVTTSRELLNAMKTSYERGTKFIGLFDYAGLYVNLLAAAGHRSRALSSGKDNQVGK